MLTRLSIGFTAMAMMALPTVVHAAGPAIAYATANLNMRAGPGTNYPVIATVPRAGGVTVFGCTADFSWCNAAFANAKGWVSGRYLSYGGTGIHYGRPIPSAGINLGVPRYHRDYPIYPSGPVYKGGPVAVQPPPPAQPRVYDRELYPFARQRCPRYPDRYFEHQVC